MHFVINFYVLCSIMLDFDSSLLSALWWLYVTYNVNRIVYFCVKLCFSKIAFFALSFTCNCLIWFGNWNNVRREPLGFLRGTIDRNTVHIYYSATFFCSLVLYVSCIFEDFSLFLKTSKGLKLAQRRPRVGIISFFLPFHCAHLQPWFCNDGDLHRVETKMAFRRCAKMWKNESFPEIL